MGLFDLFKPAWQSKNNEKALKAIEKISNKLFSNRQLGYATMSHDVEYKLSKKLIKIIKVRRDEPRLQRAALHAIPTSQKFILYNLLAGNESVPPWPDEWIDNIADDIVVFYSGNWRMIDDVKVKNEALIALVKARGIFKGGIAEVFKSKIGIAIKKAIPINCEYDATLMGDDGYHCKVCGHANNDIFKREKAYRCICSFCKSENHTELVSYSRTYTGANDDGYGYVRRRDTKECTRCEQEVSAHVVEL